MLEPLKNNTRLFTCVIVQLCNVYRVTNHRFVSLSLNDNVLKTLYTCLQTTSTAIRIAEQSDYE